MVHDKITFCLTWHGIHTAFHPSEKERKLFDKFITFPFKIRLTIIYNHGHSATGAK